MDIKKSVLSVITALAIMVTATCFARISTDDLIIGGLYPGQPWSEVISIYGQPNMRQGTNEYIFWVNKGKILLRIENEHVVFINVLNGTTPTTRGISRGVSKQEIINIYGQPDDIVITGQLENLDYYADNGRLRLSLYQNRLDYIRSSGTANSARPSSQAPKRPTSTIPKAVQEMPESDFYIGGITVGQALDYVEQIYGKPGKIDDQGYIQVYNYNDLFVVQGKLNNGYKVCSVAIYEKGLTTPGGFTVDMPYEEVTKKYGVGHEIKFKAEGVEAKLKGCKDYTYFCNNKQMVFLVDKKGVIKAIRVEDRDESKFIEVMRK